jgi:2-polyprenyl-3-methyl-5-hydroxy-6-metoxy-1,4-benzoquinol methylase
MDHTQHAHDEEYGKQAWEERYQSRTHVWSGNPNAVLVAEVADLTPGTALDAGSGEGADACWLAERGWQVTGIDLSDTAVERARQHAAEKGLDVTFEQLDLTVQDVTGSYDLVSAFFLHFPKVQREQAYSRLAAAVSPGGTLLIVGHDPSDAETTMPRHGLLERGWTAGDMAEWLGEGWFIDVAEARPRQVVDPEGREVTIHDAVVRARRR